MPLTTVDSRRLVHTRSINMQVFERDDGLFDAEAQLIDAKPFDFMRVGALELVAAGSPIHDLKVRITVDERLVLQAIEAAADVTPWSVCREAEATLSCLVGVALARGWAKTVKERLRGAASCTHLAEMLIPLATTALQGILGVQSEAQRRAKAPQLVDSCYGFGAGTSVIQWLVPEQYQERAGQAPASGLPPAEADPQS